MLEIHPKNDGDIEPVVSFRFDSGPRAGLDFIGTARFCDQPTCLCDLAHFKLAQRGGDNTVVSFAIGAHFREVDNRGTTSGKDLSFARYLALSLTETEWQALLIAFTEAKEAVTETVDVQKVLVHFPDNGDNSTIFWYREVLPYAGQFRFNINGEHIDAFDSYCAIPDCPCTEAILTFVRPGSDHRGRPEDYSEVRLSYRDKKIVEVVRDVESQIANTSALVEALIQEIPTIWQRLSTRHENIKALYERFSSEEPPTIEPVKVKKIGRNDPCPCGSGKKFKKCCADA
jgi:uncharacterized coiled-coil protein SlyX